MRGPVGFVVNGIACSFIIVFIIIFCFPFALPVDAQTMNYTSLITGGLTILVGIFWIFRKGSYVGPHFVPLESVIAKDAI